VADGEHRNGDKKMMMTEQKNDSQPGDMARSGAIALVADLVFASRIRGVAALVGVTVRTVSTPAALLQAARSQHPGLIFVDLDARTGAVANLIEELKGDPELSTIQVIAFGSHLEREALQAARSAGADRVLARSAFVRELQRLLRGMDVADSAGG
jgi:CheY-like chemotaxis protein